MEKRIDELEIDLKKQRFNLKVLRERYNEGSLIEFLEKRIEMLESQLAEIFLLEDEWDEDDEKGNSQKTGEKDETDR